MSSPDSTVSPVPVVVPPEAIVPPDDIRPTPGVSKFTLQEINAVLDALPANAAGAVLEIPKDGKLQLAAYFNTGAGLSFYAWGKIEKDNSKSAGVAVKKVFGGRS